MPLHRSAKLPLPAIELCAGSGNSISPRPGRGPEYDIGHGIDYWGDEQAPQTCHRLRRGGGGEENEERANTDQDRVGLSNVCAFLGLDIDVGGQEDSPATIDTDDDRIKEVRVNPMSDCARESNTDDLTNTALAADRYGLSNRAVAAVINGFQMDIGRALQDKTQLLVDPQLCL